LIFLFFLRGDSLVFQGVFENLRLQNVVFRMVIGCKIVVKAWLETPSIFTRKIFHFFEIYFWPDLPGRLSGS
jgi:hypothetical protein